MRIFELSAIAVTALITFAFAWSLLLNEFREQREAHTLRRQYEEIFLQSQLKTADAQHLQHTINALLQQRLHNIVAELDQLKAEMLEPAQAAEKPADTYSGAYFNYAAQRAGAAVAAVELQSEHDDNLWEYTNFTNTHVNSILGNGLMEDCFAFRGSKCGIVIKLAVEIYVERLELLYRTKLADMSNAPKDFVIYGIADNEQHFLGFNTYDITNNQHTQTFNIQESPLKFGMVRVLFISNHGNANEICVTSIGVYGSET